MHQCQTLHQVRPDGPQTWQSRLPPKQAVRATSDQAPQGHHPAQDPSRCSHDGEDHRWQSIHGIYACQHERIARRRRHDSPCKFSTNQTEIHDVHHCKIQCIHDVYIKSNRRKLKRSMTVTYVKRSKSMTFTLPRKTATR